MQKINKIEDFQLFENRRFLAFLEGRKNRLFFDQKRPKKSKFLEQFGKKAEKKGQKGKNKAK